MIWLLARLFLLVSLGAAVTVAKWGEGGGQAGIVLAALAVAICLTDPYAQRFLRGERVLADNERPVASVLDWVERITSLVAIAVIVVAIVWSITIGGQRPPIVILGASFVALVAVSARWTFPRALRPSSLSRSSATR